jgi:flagellar hook-basal body complex protein FliE
MDISAIGSVAGLTGTPPVGAAAPTSPTGAADFASILGGTIDGLQQTQATADALNVQAVTGNLEDIHKATIATTRAQVELELVAAVRNKGVDAFNEIMRMQA